MSNGIRPSKSERNSAAAAADPLDGLANEATKYVVSPSTVCRSFPGMTRQQMKLCRRLPDVTAAAIEGIDNAVRECQHQLRHRRWNCSSLSTKNGNPYTHEIMRRGEYIVT